MRLSLPFWVVAYISGFVKASPLQRRQSSTATESAVLIPLEHANDPSSFACHGVLLDNGPQGCHLQREKSVTLWWKTSQVDITPDPTIMLEFMTPAGRQYNITGSLSDPKLQYYTFTTPSASDLTSSGPFNLTSARTDPVHNVFLVEDISSCRTPISNNKSLPVYIIPVIGVGALALATAVAIPLFRRHRRMLRSKKKGKACEGARRASRLQQMQEKTTNVPDWMAKVVQKGTKAPKDPDSSSVSSDVSAKFGSGSSKSAGSDEGLLHSNRTTPRTSINVTRPTPCDTEERRPVVRTYNGPPPRCAGGSSTWQAPMETGILCRAIFAHKPEQDDEMELRRNDYVVVDMYFEDGWVMVRMQDPLKYKFGKGKEKAEIIKWWPKGKRKDKDLADPTRIDSVAVDIPKTPVDQTQGGMVPWHCLTPVGEMDVRQYAKQMAEVAAAATVDVAIKGGLTFAHRA